MNTSTKRKGCIMMLDWVVIFLVLALVAAFFGFGGVAAQATGIAQILFGIFLILLVVSLVMRVLRK